MLSSAPPSRGPTRSRLSLAFVALALPFGASGACGGGTACFQYTQAEYALHGNSCPAQEDALPNFSDPNCPGAVVAVDSDGSFDGQICCYAVTYSSVVPDCGVANPTGGNVSVGPSGIGGNFGGTTEATFESAGVGGTGPTSGCQPTCNEALANGGAACSGSALTFFNALQGCVCATVGLCTDACEPLCESVGIDAPCSTCVQQICSSQLTACMNN